MAQSFSNLLVHIIFSTKNRLPMISPEITEELYSYIVGISHTYTAHVHAIGGVEDHVHLLVSLPRTLNVSELVENIKKGSSKWIKTKGYPHTHFGWQSGYGAFSIGQSGYDGVRKYIQTQKEHHKRISFQDEFRTFLEKYRVAYEEKYLWD